MGATASSGLSPSDWTKPKGYKGTDLDGALKAYQPFAGKTVDIPKNLIPDVPKASIKSMDDCITKMKSAIVELEKGKTYLNQVIAALKKVQDAASKTAAELNKLANTKNIDGSEFEAGATRANSIASLAAGAASKLE